MIMGRIEDVIKAATFTLFCKEFFGEENKVASELDEPIFDGGWFL